MQTFSERCPDRQAGRPAWPHLAVLLATAIGLGATLPATAAADKPLRYPIKPLPEHMFTTDINNLGDAASTVKSRDGITLGAVWRDSEPQWMPSAPGDTEVEVNAINDRGDAVGQTLGPNRIVRPVLFRDSALIELLFSPGQTPAHDQPCGGRHRLAP